MKKLFFSLLFLTLIVAGCGNETSSDHQHHSQNMPNMVPIAVEIEMTPTPITTQNPVTITAIVTQDGEKVDDASEVMFEIWQNGQDDHEMIEGVHQGEGRYSIEKSFTEKGTYYVVAHVTARNMHNMPKKEFIVE